MPKFEGRSHIGKIRADNQDSFECEELGDDCGFAVVCDGMGGAKGGEVASSLAAGTIVSVIRADYREGMTDGDITGMLAKACEAANAEVYRRSVADPDLAGMGTTVVAAFVAGGSAYIIHVGDSRAYLIKDTGILQITSDHSVVQQLVDSGEISPEAARTHPQKNIITKAIGVDGYLSYDCCRVILDKGDVLLLCTDGLTNMVSDSEIFRLVSQSRDVSALIDAALDGGGSDNITAVLVY